MKVPIANNDGYYVTDEGQIFGPRGLRILHSAQRGGHLRIRIRGKHHFVHCLVLEAFIGPRPEGYVCRHKDGDPANNHISNLSWGTLRENYDDTIKHGRLQKTPSPEDIYAVLFMRKFKFKLPLVANFLEMGLSTVERYVRNYGPSLSRTS